MSIRVASWNTEGRLGWIARKGRGSPNRIVDALLGLDADVIFLPEAFGVRTAKGVNERLRQAGYAWHDAQYRDAGKPPQPGDSNPHNRFLYRIPLILHSEARYADIRTMQTVIVLDPATHQEIRIMGIHLDDRSETLRIAQVEDLADHVLLDKRPTVLMGDFNAVYRAGIARFIGSGFMKFVARMMPNARARSLLVRLSDMATGTALDYLLSQARLQEADPAHQPTMTLKTRGFLWLPSLRIVQLDHMLYSDSLSVTGYAIAADGGSDHRAISATVEVK